VAGASGTAAIRVYFLKISVKPTQVCTKFNEIGVFSYFFYFYVYFRAGVLGAPVWEPGPKNFGRACRRPQNGPSGALPVTILGAPVEML
jgi:hypothetical protein